MNTIAMVKNTETGKTGLTELDGEYTVADTVQIYEYQQLDDIAQHKQYIHVPSQTKVVHKQYSTSAYNVLRAIQKITFSNWEAVVPEMYVLCYNHDLDLIETLEMFIEGQTLSSFLDDEYSETTLFDILTFANNMISILADFEDEDIILRDLAPQNIILETPYTPYIIDFNSACFGDIEDFENDRPVGTIGYASPEHFELNSVTPKSDVYSLGIILNELLDTYDNDELDHPAIIPIVKTIISQMISNDPKKRPLASSMVNLFHFLNQVDYEDDVDADEYYDYLSY